MLLPGVSGIVPNPSSWFDFGAAINGFIVLVLTLLHQLGRDTELKIERFCMAVSYVILHPLGPLHRNELHTILKKFQLSVITHSRKEPHPGIL